MLHRLVSRRPSECFLLGKGYRLQSPRCSLCARELDLPDRNSETFLLAAPMANAKPSIPVNGASTWLFFGTKVLVAAVSKRLAPMLDASVAFFGEKVLVAMARIHGADRGPLVFCRDCGASVLEKVNPPSRDFYGWDWLADLKPRKEPPLARLRRLLPIGQSERALAAEILFGGAKLRPK